MPNPLFLNGRGRPARAAVLALAFVCGGPAAAQPQSDDADVPRPLLDAGADQPETWQWRVRPSFWLAASSGKLRAGSGSDTRTLNRLNLDNPSAAFYLEADVRRENWRCSFDGFFFQDDGETRLANSARMFDITLPAGRQLDTSFQAWSASAGGWYRLFDYSAASDASGHAMRFDLFAGGGARVLGVETSVDVVAGPSGSERGFFGQAFIGGRAEMVIDERFAFTVQLDAGAGVPLDEFVALHIFAGAEWRFRDDAALALDYQHLDVDIDTDDLYWSGRIAGLYAGLSFQF